MLAEFIQLPKEGETVGPFLLREMISASILGSFYLATDRVTHEPALLHILPEALLRADARFQQRYRETVDRQAKLAAGPVMPVRNVFRHAGNLVVQYPGGHYQSLGQVVSDEAAAVQEERVREWLAELGKGLAEAAKLDQGHYFLTPDFLFLDANGRLRVAGLGLFQSIQYEAFERFVSGAVIPIISDNKRRFSVLETLSPEIRNFKTPDPRSDFYGIGMCAYFMLTGRQPERRWSLPSKARKGLGQGWDLFISHCLEPRPIDRFPNYRAYLRDLEHLDELGSQPAPERGRMRRTLSRVPLPSAVEDRLGVRALMLARLLVLGLAGLLAVGTASIFLRILFADGEQDAARRPIRLVQDPGQANLILEIDLAEAQVVVSGPESGRFQVRGHPLLLHGVRGTYQVQVAAPRRRTEAFTVQLSAREPVVRQVRLEYHFVDVRVQGEVGTEVYVEESPDLLLYLGRIGEPDGLLLENRLLSGTYRIIGLHPWFLPAQPAPVGMERGISILKLIQDARPTLLEVRSEPPGAAVYLDRTLLGVTPLRYEGVAVGHPFQLRVEKEGFRAHAREVEFERGQAITMDAGDLVPSMGWLHCQLDLSRPAPPLDRLDLRLNGEPIPVQPRQQLELATGFHLLTLEHPDFFPLSRIVEVLDGAVTEVTLGLEPRPARLRVHLGVPNPASFAVDDREVSLTPTGELLLPAGEPVKVEASVRDFMTVVQFFVAEPNASLEWEVPLKPLADPVFEEDWQPPYFDIPLVWIAPGSFVMGSPVTEHRRLPNEDARTTVRFADGFWIGAKEVTQTAYLRVMGDNPSQFRGDNLPVDSVSWEMAMEFGRRLTQFEQQAGRLPDGYSYRLPTEAEWEFAARAGTDSPFSFGPSATPEHGNFLGAYRPAGPVPATGERYGTLPAGSFPPNPWGLHDVHGNVAEWTLDRYWDRLPGGMRRHPVNSTRGRGYTVRGGSWQDGAERVRSAARMSVSPSVRRNSIGFRLVLAPDPLETVR